MKGVFTLLRATFQDFSKDEATWKAAALSYYTVFALPPLLVLLLEIASAVWNPDQVRHALTGQFESMMGPDVAGQIQTMINSAQQKVSGSGVRLLLSVAGLIFGATGAFLSLQSALNRAWEVAPDPKKGGVKVFITKRFLSLGMVLGIAFLLLVSLALTSAVSAASGVLFGGAAAVVANVLDLGLSFAVVAALFAAMFNVLPDAKVSWRDCWVGGIATAVLFDLGKYAIGLYVAKSHPGSAFGAAGSLAVLFVWIYYAAVIVLLGAEFTQAWAKAHGREIAPEKGAIRLIDQEQRIDESGAVETESKHAASDKAAADCLAAAHEAHGETDRLLPARSNGHSPGWFARLDPFRLVSRAHDAATFARNWLDGVIERLREDLAVARRELGGVVRGIGTGSALFATGAVLALLGVLSLLAGVVMLVGDQWLPHDWYWLAALGATVITGAVAAWLVRRGMAVLAPDALRPTETIETLREDAAWLRRERGERQAIRRGERNRSRDEAATAPTAAAP